MIKDLLKNSPRLNLHSGGSVGASRPGARARLGLVLDLVEHESDMEASVDSMDFIKGDNVRQRRLGGRGLTTGMHSMKSEAVQVVAIFLTGFVVALVVQLLRWCIAMVENGRLALLFTLLPNGATPTGDIGLAFAWYILSSTLLACLAVGVALRVVHTKGSGLPSLIAYLNGIKLRGFTSVRVLVAKFLGTVLAVSSGLCVGPEGPIIQSARAAPHPAPPPRAALRPGGLCTPGPCSYFTPLSLVSSGRVHRKASPARALLPRLLLRRPAGATERPRQGGLRGTGRGRRRGAVA